LNKGKCCPNASDCLNYNEVCVKSKDWSFANSLNDPLDYCASGSWLLGSCVATDIDCLVGIPHTFDTRNCGNYLPLECGIDAAYVVIAMCVKDEDCRSSLFGTRCINNICGCYSEEDCPGYDPDTKVKRYCDDSTHTCKPLERCSYNIECEPGWCCDNDPELPTGCRGSGVCVKKGSIMCNNQYICDPPEGFDRVSKLEQESKENPSKKLALLDLLANLFHFLTK